MAATLWFCFSVVGLDAAELNDEDKKQITTLVKQLGDSQYQVRQKAFDELMQALHHDHDDLWAAYLERFQDDDDLEIRHRVNRLLVKSSPERDHRRQVREKKKEGRQLIAALKKQRGLDPAINPLARTQLIDDKESNTLLLIARFGDVLDKKTTQGIHIYVDFYAPSSFQVWDPDELDRYPLPLSSRPAIEEVVQTFLEEEDFFLPRHVGFLTTDRPGRVVVTDLQPESPAQRSGLKILDQIVQVNDQAIKDVYDLWRIFQDPVCQKEVKLFVKNSSGKSQRTVVIRPHQ